MSKDDNSYDANQKRVKKILKNLLEVQNIKDPARIGTLLRDEYVIPNVKQYTGKKLGYFLPNLQNNYALERLKRKKSKLEVHVKKNIHDYVGSRAMVRLNPKIYHAAKTTLSANKPDNEKN